MDTLLHALDWMTTGVVPIPILPYSKLPAVRWTYYRENPPTVADVQRWFVTDRNLALLCGPQSNSLVVLDFDQPLAYHKWRARTDIETYTVMSARGYHAYFWIEGQAQTLAMPGGEVKASGYVLTVPSIHPNGARYRIWEAFPVMEAESLEQIGLVDLGDPLPIPSAPSIGNDTTGIINLIKSLVSVVDYLQELGAEPRPSSPDGIWWMCKCPFHDDEHPSMWVNTQRDICRCFVPDCSGHVKNMDVINLYAKVHATTNREAIILFAARLGI